MSHITNEYRITLPSIYSSPTCHGYMDKSARQRHYVFSKTEVEAVQKFYQMNPDRLNYTVDVQLWSQNVAV